MGPKTLIKDHSAALVSKNYKNEIWNLYYLFLIKNGRQRQPTISAKVLRHCQAAFGSSMTACFLFVDMAQVRSWSRNLWTLADVQQTTIMPLIEK